MRKTAISVVVITAVLVSSWALAGSGESNGDARHLELSAGLAELLREEMQEITEGVQDVTLALSIGDWETIVRTSEKIRASYILNKEISDAQRKELEEKLPHEFKELDEAFHSRAEKLGVAAMNHDAELAAFHLYRMIEACTTCHSAYAESRFPGFKGGEPEEEGHHH